MEIRQETIQRLPVYVYETRLEVGIAAAKSATEHIQSLLTQKGDANIVFAAAPSQSEMLASVLSSGIDFSQVRAFHQDEYIDLADDHPAGFGNFLQRNVFSKTKFKEIFFINGNTSDPEASCAEYAALLEQYPPDLIFLGFGENGHLAFNDPPVADFSDPKAVKVVELDNTCRQQQVNDGCFSALNEVPKYAITLTLSTIFKVPRAIIVVSASTKANAVYAALRKPISTACPGSIMREHPSATLYLDRDSASKAFT